jgi:hypothetical protein
VKVNTLDVEEDELFGKHQHAESSQTRSAQSGAMTQRDSGSKRIVAHFHDMSYNINATNGCMNISAYE